MIAHKYGLVIGIKHGSYVDGYQESMAINPRIIWHSSCMSEDGDINMITWPTTQ
jgi:hypothetical protein